MVEAKDGDLTLVGVKDLGACLPIPTPHQNRSKIDRHLPDINRRSIGDPFDENRLMVMHLSNIYNPFDDLDRTEIYRISTRRKSFENYKHNQNRTINIVKSNLLRCNPMKNPRNPTPESQPEHPIENRSIGNPFDDLKAHPRNIYRESIDNTFIIHPIGDLSNIHPTKI